MSEKTIITSFSRSTLINDNQVKNDMQQPRHQKKRHQSEKKAQEMTRWQLVIQNLMSQSKHHPKDFYNIKP